ncbi:hypothetical protein AMATHDRAFT_10792 [Amanita thiersii Skay4041]|uniref:Uncharacterized protein n=1 Tax=Amanita thiersii Skay4041 TaxID=703135 RepID=A0A2A9N7L9_9AGAR|nr:hypothetical protein AMATHDRAFT_10792 [Amanita thiersii Skay4041]
MHCFPFKKVKKTQPNSGTGFFYVAPGYKLSMEEIHKVQSKNFNTNSYAEELRRKELFALRKLPPKSVNKSKISRPRPLHPPQHEIVLHYDNHIRLYCKYINSLQLDNHVHLYRQHIVQLKKCEEKRRATELAQWRYNERLSQREQDEAWDILQRLKQKQRYEDLRAKKRQDEEIWTTIQRLKRKERYEDLRTKRRQDYARSHAYQIETLTRNLEYHPDLRRSLLKDSKNRFLTWLRGGVQLLKKYGWSISNKERNRFQHSLNGNYIPFEIAERLPLVVMRHLTMYHWSDDIRRVLTTCEYLEGFARINFLALHIRHRYFVWIAGGEPLLNHYGWTLSAEERNRFMHALNGNIEAIHERILLVQEFHEAILYIMESLQDAPQATIDSFFECRANRFLIWVVSESLLNKYGIHITEDERNFFFDTLQVSFLSREERNRAMHALNGNRNFWATRGQLKEGEIEEEQSIFIDPQLLQQSFLTMKEYAIFRFQDEECSSGS